MSKSIAVFGAGPGLGQAVAHRYAREGYDVVLVARRPEPLQRLATDLASGGGTVHVISADLADSPPSPHWPSRSAARSTTSTRSTTPQPRTETSSPPLA